MERPKRRLQFVLLVWISLVFSQVLLAQTAPQLPAALRDWQDWVRHEQEYRACPLMSGADADDEDSYLCAWPDVLDLQVGAQGARFTQSWTLYAQTAVPLPGSEELWPQSVQVNGQAAPVVLGDLDQPLVWLPPGNYRISGNLQWTERPESIDIDSRLARIALSVDGARVFPLQRDDDSLWLGRAESTEQEADSLDLQVFRRLSDEVPQRLETLLRLRVSGKGREESLAQVLPPGFTPVALGGGLVSRIEADGSLHVQVRPGTHEISVQARADEPMTRFSVAAHTGVWPTEEIWSYQAQTQLRVTDAGGPPQIDPVMAEVPEGWRALPAFAMAPDAVLEIQERSRGLSDQDMNRLSLSRELWMDFSGDGWTSKDRINGSVMRDWRLDLAPPYQLTRADENGFALLITAGQKPGWTGVEVRERQLALTASTRLKSGSGELPVTGWQTPFESVSTRLNFPPGYELIAARGADRAPEAWLDRWDLLDVFVAALIVFLSAIAFGRLAALIPLGYVLLAWHLQSAPKMTLLIALAAMLLAGAVTQGVKLPLWLRRIAQLSAVILVLVSVPFAAGQIRQALHPQLEQGQYATSTAGYYEANDSYAGVIAPAPQMYENVAAEPPATIVQDQAQELERVQVTGSRIKRVNGRFAADTEPMPQRMKRYETNVIVQAGGGEPTWAWRSYNIEIAGPVQPEQSVRLLISPPWLTRLTRLLITALLAGSLLMLLKAVFKPVAVKTPKLAASLLVILLGAGAANATEVPTPELLKELGERVLALPECTPECGHIARAEVSAAATVVTVSLELHAVEALALPLPGNEQLLDLQTLRLDGVAASGTVRGGDGTLWLLVPRGVHRATLEWRTANADSISLRFPMAPGFVEFRGQDWQASGIDEGQLATGSLELTRLAGTDEIGSRAGVAQRFAPFVQVTRELRFDLDWSLTTTVTRISPQDAAFSIAVPLLSGERVMSTGFQVEKAVLTVPFADGQSMVSWESRLDPVDALSLTAPDQGSRAEVWRLNVSPTWNVLPSGVPGVHPQSGMYQFHPLPGEVLELSISRPPGVTGNTIAIDSAQVESRVGKRSTDHELSLSLRATQGGQHSIGLPTDAEVMELKINGRLINIRPQAGKLSLPLTPGVNEIVIKWRDGKGAGMRMQTPEIALNADASNLRVGLILPEQRWVVATSGPRIGPAVLYWGELLVMALLAWGLSRTRRTPLRLVDWLLLGIGFSTVGWTDLVVFALWLFALDWRSRLQPDALRWKFNFVQIGLVFLTLAAAAALFSAIRTGLLGAPDLHVTGNGSYAHSLKWFHDQTESAMPVGSVFTLPMWLYRMLMLAWAFWMAWALIRWMRWAVQCFVSDGAWRAWFKRKPQAAVLAAASPAGQAAAAEQPSGNPEAGKVE